MPLVGWHLETWKPYSEDQGGNGKNLAISLPSETCAPQTNNLVGNLVTSPPHTITTHHHGIPWRAPANGPAVGMPSSAMMPRLQLRATEENQALVVSRVRWEKTNKQPIIQLLQPSILGGRFFFHLGSRSVYPKCLANPFWEAHLSCRFWTTVSRKPLATPQLNIQYKIPNHKRKNSSLLCPFSISSSFFNQCRWDLDQANRTSDICWTWPDMHRVARGWQEGKGGSRGQHHLAKKGLKIPVFLFLWHYMTRSWKRGLVGWTPTKKNVLTNPFFKETRPT